MNQLEYEKLEAIITSAENRLYDLLDELFKVQSDLSNARALLILTDPQPRTTATLDIARARKVIAGMKDRGVKDGE